MTFNSKTAILAPILFPYKCEKSIFQTILPFSGLTIPAQYSHYFYMPEPIYVFIFVDLKKLYFMAGVDYKPTIFLFNDTQVLDESFLEDINNILSSGEVPNLYKPDEFEEVSGM